MRIITKTEYESRIRDFLNIAHGSLPYGTTIHYDGAAVLDDDEYVED